MIADTLDDLQEKLEHDFRDGTLLRRALTHSSVRGARADARDLERLEFLGDRVLGLMTAEALWRTYPEEDEGVLAQRFNNLVRTETCANAAMYFGLDAALDLSEGEAAAGGRRKPGILADVTESVLGALYIDGGLEAARRMFALFWEPRLEELSAGLTDPKTALQEWSQAHGAGLPAYLEIGRSGPDHAPSFSIEVQVAGVAPARANGGSKRAAERAAAEVLLRREGVWSKSGS